MTNTNSKGGVNDPIGATNAEKLQSMYDLITTEYNTGRMPLQDTLLHFSNILKSAELWGITQDSAEVPMLPDIASDLGYVVLEDVFTNQLAA